MNLANPVEIVVHYLIIGGMIFLGHWNEFPILSVLVYVMHTEQDLWRIMM